MKNLTMLLLFMLLISGCAPAEKEQSDYEGTKKMIVDILKTDEGKKAIQDILTDEKTKAELIMNEAVVSETIKNTLTSEEAQAFWKKNFDDPKFAETFAKSMQKEHEKLIKELMKDPDYQKMMIEILKNPEMEKQFTDTIKSQQVREQMKTIILETTDSPLFKAKMQEMLIKGAEEIQKEGGKNSGNQKGGDSGDSSGDQKQQEGKK